MVSLESKLASFEDWLVSFESNLPSFEDKLMSRGDGFPALGARLHSFSKHAVAKECLSSEFLIGLITDL